MRLIKAARGVLLSPRRTFEALASSPACVRVVVTSVAVSAAAWATFLATERGRVAFVDQWESAAYAVGRPLDDAGFETLRQWAERAPIVGATRAALLYPALAIGAGGALAGLLRRRSGRSVFRPSLSVAAHAGLILALRDLVAAQLAYARETTASATALGLWFPGLDELSVVARVLNSVDVFVLWWVLLLAVGASVLSGESAAGWAARLVGAYLLLAVAAAVGLGFVAGPA